MMDGPAFGMSTFLLSNDPSFTRHTHCLRISNFLQNSIWTFQWVVFPWEMAYQDPRSTEYLLDPCGGIIAAATIGTC